MNLSFGPYFIHLFIITFGRIKMFYVAENKCEKSIWTHMRSTFNAFAYLNQQYYAQTTEGMCEQWVDVVHANLYFCANNLCTVVVVVVVASIPLFAVPAQPSTHRFLAPVLSFNARNRVRYYYNNNYCCWSDGVANGGFVQQKIFSFSFVKIARLASHCMAACKISLSSSPNALPRSHTHTHTISFY